MFITRERKLEIKEENHQSKQIDDILEYASYKGEFELISEFGLRAKYAGYLLEETIKKLNEANANYAIEGVEGIFMPEEIKKINRDFIKENYENFCR